MRIRRKQITQAIAGLLVALATVSLPVGISEARFNGISASSEKFHAKEILEDFYSDEKIESIFVDDDIFRIQKEVVDANPQALWFEDGIHDYFLHPVLVLNYKEKIDKAQNIPDGYILISNGRLSLINRKKSNAVENIYNNSKLAFILAHEMGHWHNVEPLSKTHVQSRYFEVKADRTAIQFLGNTNFHGYGGALMNFSKKASKEKVPSDMDVENDMKSLDNTSSHPSDAIRFHFAKEALEKASMNRIKANVNGEIYIDGEKIDAPLLVDEVSSVERSFYVAGQIASAIERDLWKQENIRIVEQDSIFHNGSKKLAMIIVDGDSWKLIDKFNTTVEHLEKAKKALWIEQFFGFNKWTDEDEYFITVRDLLSHESLPKESNTGFLGKIESMCKSFFSSIFS